MEIICKALRILWESGIKNPKIKNFIKLHKILVFVEREISKTKFLVEKGKIAKKYFLAQTWLFETNA